MKRWITIVAALCMTAPCFAQTPDAAKTAKVEELMSVMHVDKIMEQITTQAQAQAAEVSQSILGAGAMSPTQGKIAKDYQDRVLNLVIQSLSWKTMRPQIVKLYIDNFTVQQIDDILAFYKSPSGQAFIEKKPFIMNQMMQITQTKIVAMEPKLKALTDQFTKEMAATGPTKKAPPASNPSN